MDTRFSAADEAFRAEVRDWLEANLAGEFAGIRGRGGPGDEHACVEERKAWERRLGEGGWIGLGWPREAGGRGLPLMMPGLGRSVDWQRHSCACSRRISSASSVCAGTSRMSENQMSSIRPSSSWACSETSGTPTNIPCCPLSRQTVTS